MNLDFLSPCGVSASRLLLHHIWVLFEMLLTHYAHD